MRFMAENLGARRGEELLFRDISFSLSDGEALLVTGPNGSGKSTLLRVVAGLLYAETGSVAAEGYERAAEACHYLGHRNAMKRELTVEENLDFWRDFMGGGEGAVSATEAAEAVGLGGITHLPFGYLSAGQQRRMAMAKLLVVQRPVWLLDEPTAALDAASDAMFGKLCQDFQARGGIIVAATHQPLGLKAPQSLVMKGFEYVD
ncbi:heme ABC exporter ATP-binding protein CcmA [Rhizobium sp. L1K21]|uniref:heme ABC exporter ATP-binding protein CcmA n=1 Tax=Rhizobium sp. L1K21 TaxID=2954933 RepID=UPI0020925C01|nr:heme ABC exporter ATP-binding protein CcmA [Rhizobium sp. L1K21]MCO6188074.1 heme ABC exporter ATP-binding protein CcmA [Rhizobium sp. L1K21]